MHQTTMSKEETTFRVGDRVEAIDDHIAGRVLRVNASGDITIMDEHGFEFVFRSSELMHITPGDLHKQVEVSPDVAHSKTEKKTKGNNSSKRHKKKADQIRVIDLHIHHLVDSTKGMSNYDMLNLQLETAKRFLDNAVKNHVPYVVFIHGVGEGVLKMELFTLFRRYDNLEFYEADYKTYGFGATEVKIYQNVSY
jgi:dsDNA-specific endonuclease/ATPase MutS2